MVATSFKNDFWSTYWGAVCGRLRDADVVDTVLGAVTTGEERN